MGFGNPKCVKLQISCERLGFVENERVFHQPETMSIKRILSSSQHVVQNLNRSRHQPPALVVKRMGEITKSSAIVRPS